MAFLPIGIGVGGLIALFFLVMASSFGVPSGILTIVAVGSLATSFNLLLLVIAISFVAAVFGDILAYTLALKLQERLRIYLVRFSFFLNNELKAKEKLNKYGFWIVFFTRFAITSLGAVTNYINGFEKLNKKKFILAVVTGEFLFAVIYAVIGFTLGEVLNNLLSAINYFFVAVILFLLLVYVGRHFYKKRKG